MWWKWESNFVWYVVWCVWSILDWAGSSGRYYIIHAIYIMHRFYVESAEPARPTSQLATSRHAEVAEIDGIVKFGVCCSLSPSLSSIAPGCALESLAQSPTSATMKFAPTFCVCAQHTHPHMSWVSGSPHEDHTTRAVRSFVRRTMCSGDLFSPNLCSCWYAVGTSVTFRTGALWRETWKLSRL